MTKPANARLIRPGRHYFELYNILGPALQKQEGRRISHREITDMASKMIIDERLYEMILRKKKRGLL